MFWRALKQMNMSHQEGFGITVVNIQGQLSFSLREYLLTASY